MKTEDSTPRRTALLVRAMTRFDLTALAVNGIVGSGIFALPATAARMLGFASPLAFLLCAAFVYIVVLCFAEVASHFKDSGGPYLYGRAIFGPFVGFEVGWSVWLARVSAFATNANIFVSYFAFFVPGAGSGAGRAAALIAVSAILTVINIRGVRGGAQFGNAFAGFKIAALVIFAGTGLFFVDWVRFSNLSAPPDANWGLAILALVYTFTGFEYAVIPAAEAKNPQRDLGWALVIALGGCVAIYLAIQVVALGTLGAAALSASARPLADSGRNFMGPVAEALIAGLACVSIIGNLSALVLVSPRLTLAFADLQDFPQVFGKLHPVYGTPVVSIIFFTAVGALLAVYGSFTWLVVVSVVARLGSYIVTCLAAPVLRKRAEPQFRIPFGPFIPILGVVLCMWLFSQASHENVLAFAAACGVGGVLYMFRPVSITRKRT